MSQNPKQRKLKGKFGKVPAFIAGTDTEYRNIEAWNNSALGDLYLHLRKLPTPPKPIKAFYFGSAVHRLILEPEWWFAQDWKLTKTEFRHAEGIANAAQKDEILQGLLKGARTELICTKKDLETGLKCKIKIDLMPNSDSDLIVDLKTTSQRSRLDFLESCVQYEYDRQAAFYTDTANKKRFLFIAVQKTAPYEIWYYETGVGKSFFEKGRKKVSKLLREAKAAKIITPKELYQIKKA